MSGKYCKWRISFIAEKYKSDIQTICLKNPFDKSDIPFMVFVWFTVCNFYKIHLHHYSDFRWLDFRMKYQ